MYDTKKKWKENMKLDGVYRIYSQYPVYKIQII